MAEEVMEGGALDTNEGVLGGQEVGVGEMLIISNPARTTSAGDCD